MGLCCPCHNPQGPLHITINTSLPHMTSYTVCYLPHLPCKLTHCRQVETPMEKDEQKMISLRWFLTIGEDIVWFCTPFVVGAVQVAGDDDLVDEDAGRGGPGLVWQHQASWMYRTFNWTFDWTTASN